MWLGLRRSGRPIGHSVGLQSLLSVNEMPCADSVAAFGMSNANAQLSQSLPQLTLCDRTCFQHAYTLCAENGRPSVSNSCAAAIVSRGGKA
jgi:hypothetical protein